MPISPTIFATKYPRLFHLTQACNVGLIRTSGCLKPASDLFNEAGRASDTSRHRPECLLIPVAGHPTHIRDQSPLKVGNMSLPPGWTMSTFVEVLNRHVFFWPGTANGPSRYGRNHFARYEHTDVQVLVLRTMDVLAVNQAESLRFCRYNSGAPRCSKGKKPPRGPDTFQHPSRFDGTPGSVVEVAFEGPVRLPTSFEVRTPAHIFASSEAPRRGTGD